MPLKEIPKHYRVLESCLCCGSTHLYPYLSLGMQPPCNALRTSAEDHVEEFPLETMRCSVCSHSQLSLAVSPSILFNNYPYRTGISATLRNHYTALAKRLLAGFTLSKRLKILDIGCNDCTLLNAFRSAWQQMIETWGVDPYKIEGTSPDYFIQGYWSKSLVDHYKLYDTKFHIITATNVLAHNDNPKEFLELCRDVLEDDGIIVLEFPYAKHLLIEKQFDTIYHEHISYFLVHPFTKLLKGTGLKLTDISLNQMHGGSLNITLQKCALGYETWCDEAMQFVLAERDAGLLESGFYDAFQLRVDRIKEELAALLKDVYPNKLIDEDDSLLIGFGASGKSSIMMNYCDIVPDALLDETPSKIGKFTPGVDVKIMHPDNVEGEKRRMIFIIMAWNCMDEALEKLRFYRKEVGERDFVVTYIPKVAMFPLFST